MKSIQLRNHKNVLHAGSVISVEREFALFHNNGTIINKEETDMFGRKVRAKTEMGRLCGRIDVVGEVACNSLEVKISFSTVKSIRGDIIALYRKIAAVSLETGIMVIGTSQPQHYSGDINMFFTTAVYPAAVILAGTNSIHIHSGATTEEEMINRYHIQNFIAPTLLAISQSSVIEGRRNGRARLLMNFFSMLPPQLTVPWSIFNLSDFYERSEDAKVAVEKRIRSLPPWHVRMLANSYPSFVKMNNGLPILLQLTPDKIFHFARMRPDNYNNKRGLVGSVEFRPIDGQLRLEYDLALLEFALGLTAYHERTGTLRLAESDATILTNTLYKIPEYGIHVLDNSGIDLNMEIEKAMVGLIEIGLKPQYIIEIFGMLTNQPQEKFVGLPPAHAVLMAAEEFRKSCM